MASKTRLINRLKGLIESLENDWMDEKAVYGNLLLELVTNDYMKLSEEHYIRVLDAFIREDEGGFK